MLGPVVRCARRIPKPAFATASFTPGAASNLLVVMSAVDTLLHATLDPLYLPTTSGLARFLDIRLAFWLACRQVREVDRTEHRRTAQCTSRPRRTLNVRTTL